MSLRPDSPPKTQLVEDQSGPAFEVRSVAAFQRVQHVRSRLKDSETVFVLDLWGET